MCLTNKIFTLYLDKFVIVFIDDILVYPPMEREHEDNCPINTSDNHLRAKASKCESLKEAEFLGHEASKNGTLAIMDWKRPSTISKIGSRLGLASYYRRVIQEFSILGEPMT